jgi:hypothetical protein
VRLSVLLLASTILAIPAPGKSKASESDTDVQAILNRYLEATRVQSEALRGVQMEVDIEGRLPKLEKQGRMTALRNISKLGQITYKALGFTGDNTVKKEVITRFLSTESEARESGQIAISPANYKFRLKALLTLGGARTYILQLTPRKKKVGLFKGELWLDEATGMPLRESGQLVKNPSVFLKKVRFMREYELQDGVAIPKHLESTIETRLFGNAELSVEFSNYSWPAEADASAAGTGAY